MPNPPWSLRTINPFIPAKLLKQLSTVIMSTSSYFLLGETNSHVSYTSRCFCQSMFGFPSIFSCLSWNMLFRMELQPLLRAVLFPMSGPVYTSHCNVSLSITSKHFWFVFNNDKIKFLDEFLKHGCTPGVFFHPVYVWLIVSKTCHYWITYSLFSSREFLQLARIILIFLPTLLASNQL